ncbi:MAG TPA: polyprenyl synthetase family protein [Candidatus Hydrogenedentes bacterium]|nr:polyprenyl synthetase family protein [Candidatus Hydrogenedentota bacterium]
MKTTLNLSELYGPIAPELEHVRAMIGEVWTDALNLVRVPVPERPGVGGKLLRPALCLLSARVIGSGDIERYVPLATSYEALHIASLAHDDVVDKAALRRGGSALNVLWDNHAAVLGGDYLVARAIEFLAGYNCCDIIARAIACIRRMAEGELVYFGREDAPFTREDCLALAECKTASLFAEACAGPTYLIDSAHRAPLYAFGMALGIAFQIIDDLIDVTQTAEQLGKPACGDLVEGKRTLPILYMRARLSPEEYARLDTMRGARLTEADQAWARAAVERTGAREQAEADARHFADQAVEHLAALPSGPARDSMEGLVDFILVRTS